MVTAVWGWTFVLVKAGFTLCLTLPFLQLRFILAFLVMAVIVRRLPTRRELWVGVVAGAVLAAGYLTQTVGLTMTSPGNSGLITGLFVVFTPLIDRGFGVRLRWYTLVAVAAALGGTVLVVGGPSGFGLGDILTVACAFLYALHIVLLSRWSPGLRSAPLAMLQMGTGAVIFSGSGSWSLQVPAPDVWVAIAVTGVFASALAFYIQPCAHHHLTPTRPPPIPPPSPPWPVCAAVTLAGQRC